MPARPSTPAYPAVPAVRASFPAAVLCVLFAATGLVGTAGAQTGLDLGASSFQFLKLSLSPRVTAMGGAGAALAGGPSEAEVNPAVAAGGKGAIALGQEYPPREFGTSASQIAWKLPWNDRSVLLHARYLGFDEIPGWDNDNNATTPYEAHTLKLQAGMAGRNYGVDWGGSAAYARNNIADLTYSAFLLNAGLRRDLPLGLSAGASVMNVSLWADETKETGETVEPPLILQAGVGYGRQIRAHSRIVLALDARRVAEEDVVFPVGAEYVFLETLSLRAGYPVGDPDNGMGLGIGLKWSRFAFHYAYKHHAMLSGGHGWVLEIGDL